MKWLVVLLPLALPACSRVENTFVVEDEQRAVVAASLLLCGDELRSDEAVDNSWLAKLSTVRAADELRFATHPEPNTAAPFAT